MSDLSTEITALVSLKKEGEYWDFKLKHHNEPADLVKDIICLANTVRHSGPRYLVMGVRPDNYQIVGLDGSSPRRSQADVISTLRNAGFSSGYIPDILLELIKLDGKEVDIIVISDSPHKPFYLEDDYSKNGKVIVRSGVVYSRTQDANTPSDKTAPAVDIEGMWRERFGLNYPPFERVKRYLLDFDGWENIEEDSWYYKDFPEFTVSPTEEDTWEVLGGENWVRAAINPKAFVRPMTVKFHQTVLAKVVCIYFDEMRCLIPAPRVTGMNHHEGKWFYSLCADDFDFIFLQFLLRKSKEDLLANGVVSARTGDIPVLLFPSANEKDDFLTHLESNPVNTLPKHEFNLHKNDPLVTDHDRKIIGYSRAVIEYYHERK